MGRKWHNIKDKKASKDLNASRTYAKFAREIYVAAKRGVPDPELNQALRFVIERAKTYNVPKHVIDKAVEKAKGSSDENFDELRYEGFGPNGSMVIVETLTNNVNRTASDVRSTFTKYGGNLGVTGSVAYMFDETAVIGLEGKTEDEILEILLEADIDVRDVLDEDPGVIVYAEPDQFQAVQSALREAGITEFTVAEITMLPQNEVTLQDKAKTQFEKMIDTLEDFEDVQQVYHNVDLGE